jgi:nucleotide-binding universal stress UspA family protein
MDLIRKILAPTDLSAFSAKGVRYAFELAKALGAEVIAIHAVPTAEFLSHSRRLDMAAAGQEANLLERLADRHKQALGQFLEKHLADLSDLKTRQIVEMGAPRSLIVDMAEKEGVDLIVMSTHGRSGLPRMALGSVTERVLRRAHCPVLAIPSHEG